MNLKVRRQRNQPSCLHLSSHTRAGSRKWRSWISEPRQWQADGLLLLVCLIWGSTFVLVKQSVSRFPVYAFLCLRFTFAALMLLLLFGRRLWPIHSHMAMAGAVIGLFLFGGYAFQTIGLQYTTASKAGFITGLSVVIVPILSALLLRRVPERHALLGVIFSTVGLALLTLERSLTPVRGDLIVLGCAFCFALHIVSVSIFAPQMDALALTIVQITVVALLSGTVTLILEGVPQSIPADICLAAAFTGTLATAFAFAIQNSVQTWTTATHTALIFATEPVFAALFGYLLAGERLTNRGILGCMLILLGMLFAELRPAVSTSLKNSKVSSHAELSAKMRVSATDPLNKLSQQVNPDPREGEKQ